MTVWEDREPDKPPQRETVVRSIDLRTIGVWVMLGLIGALLILSFSGCSPLTGPAGERIGPVPEQGLSAIPPALVATEGELATVCTSTKVIKGEVADMVPTVRKLQTVAPPEASRVAKGHETIYAAASTAEAAALEAQSQVRNASASTAQVEAELKELREAHQREIKALGQQVEDLKQDNLKLHEAAASRLHTLAGIGVWGGGILIALGVAALVFLRGVPTIGIGIMAAGAIILALSAAFQKFAEYVPWAGLVILAGATAWAVVVIKKKTDETDLLDDVAETAIRGYDDAKAAVRQAVANTGTAAMAVDAAIEKVGADAKVNMPEPVRMEIWRRRKG